jgi:hypothetical protein
VCIPASHSSVVGKYPGADIRMMLRYPQRFQAQCYIGAGNGVSSSVSSRQDIWVQIVRDQRLRLVGISITNPSRMANTTKTNAVRLLSFIFRAVMRSYGHFTPTLRGANYSQGCRCRVRGLHICSRMSPPVPDSLSCCPFLVDDIVTPIDR